MVEINKLTHDNHCKLIDLVIKKVVEAVPDVDLMGIDPIRIISPDEIIAPELSEAEIEELAQQRSANPVITPDYIPPLNTPAYEKRWHEKVQENLRQRFHKARQEAGAE